MDLAMFTDAAAVMAAAAIIIMVGTFIALRKIRKGTQTSISRWPRSRRRRKEDICGICLGPVLTGDLVAGCTCGRTFHDACAKPTGMCPYCGCDYTDFTVESPCCVKCPSCGSDVVGSVCECGAVVNRDGFTCSCGNGLDADDPVCKRCGKRYTVRSGRDNRGK